jgi:hypothetical protein
VGFTLWCFILTDSGEFTRYPLSRYGCFVLRKAPLQEPRRGDARFAEVYVELYDRKAVSLAQIVCRRFELDQDGFVEARYHAQVHSDFLTTLDRSIRLDEPSNIRFIAPRVAEKRLVQTHFWQPTNTECEALANAIGSRARDILVTPQEIRARLFQRDRSGATQ